MRNYSNVFFKEPGIDSFLLGDSCEVKLYNGEMAKDLRRIVRQKTPEREAKKMLPLFLTERCGIDRKELDEKGLMKTFEYGNSSDEETEKRS